MNITVLIIGLIVAMFGKVLLGYTVITVHSRIQHEHKLDGEVFKAISRERMIAVWGIVLIIVGTAFEIAFYLNGPFT